MIEFTEHIINNNINKQSYKKEKNIHIPIFSSKVGIFIHDYDNNILMKNDTIISLKIRTQIQINLTYKEI